MTTVAEWQRALRASDFRPSYAYATKTKATTIKGSSVKSVLLFLSTWADYDTGEHAHPGVQRLAQASGFSEEIVSRALVTGRYLGWVERVEEGARGTRHADEYRLTIPSAAATTGHPRESGTATTGHSATSDASEPGHFQAEQQSDPSETGHSDTATTGPPSLHHPSRDGVTGTTELRTTETESYAARAARRRAGPQGTPSQ